MDRYLASIVLFVLIICSLFLLDDLKVIELPFFHKATHENQILIGHVKLVRNQVKRRSQDEFLWSGTKSNEDIYYYDSILTLSESQVQLELLGKSKIVLSENTLIVIEPSASDNKGEIRLKFKKGSLRSNDLNQATQIQAGDWELKLDTGTDFQLRSQNDGTYELEVQKGSAKVISEGQEKTISSDEALILKPESVEKIKLSQSIEWSTRNNIRIYSHDENAKLSLNWSGNAKTLIHSQKDIPDEAITIQNFDASHALNLPIGTHFFRLKDDSHSSKTLTVEINRSPSLHLYYPLPRDRVEVHKPIVFSWRKVAAVSQYRLEISKDAEFKNIFKTITTSENYFEYKPDTLGRFYWHVVGIDHDGFEILPVYSNEILFIEDPLGAPGVEAPQRSPSDLNSSFIPKGLWLYSLFNLLISTAHADDAPTIIFEWKKVKGADTYNLEIDDDPFFQSPEVITTTKKTYYQWPFAAKGTYYWRVAGDSKNGRLGLFSSVHKVNLSTLKTSRSPAGDFDVYVKDVSPPEVEPLPLPLRAPIIEKPDPEKPIEPVTHYNGYFGYGVGYGYYLMKTDNIEKVTVSGFQPLNFIAEYNIQNENSSIKVKTDGSYNTWKADEKKFPFQEKQEVLTGSLAALYTNHTRKFWFGARVSQVMQPYRLGLESMELRPLILVGPTLQYDAALSSIVLNHFTGSMLVGSSAYLFEVDDLIRRQYRMTETTNVSLGLRTYFNILSYKGAEGMSYTGQAQLVFGFEW